MLRPSKKRFSDNVTMQQQSPVFTADRVWVKLKLDIDIRLLR